MKCPRCDSDNARLMVKSSIENTWEMYVCDTCYYSWRSTENPSIYPKFKIKPEQIPNLQVIPPVPPLEG